MKIAFVDIFTNGGGIPVVAGRMIEGLCSRATDLEIILVSPFPDSIEILQIERPARLQIIDVPLDKKARTLSRTSKLHKLLLWGKLALYGIKIGFIFRKMQIDVIVFNLPKSGVVAFLSSLICRARLLFYCHGVQFIRDMGVIYKFLLNRSSYIVAVSTGTKDQLTSVGVDEKKISVIYNAVDISSDFNDRLIARDTLGIDQKKYTIGYVGNIIRRKGIDVLLRAFAELRKTLKDGSCILAVVGADTHDEGGAFFETVKLIIEENTLAEHVVFIGYRSDAAKMMRAFDLFVMPSRMESFGVAIIEAMAAGVPVIASRTGSIPEVITDGQNGLLFESLNHKELASKMLLLIHDENTRKALTHAAIRDVKTKFSLVNQVDSFHKLLIRRFS